MTHFFITGAARSGTTLLCDLLGSLPELQVHSQPFPLLFVESKQRFHRSIGYTGDWLPLANYATGLDYRPNDVDRFLDKDIVDADTIADVFKRSKLYSGTKTPITPDNDALEAGCFYSLFKQLLTQQIHDGSYTIAGSKEILCEEFIQHFVHNGIKCIGIVRDPRDMIASMNHGRGHAFTGSIRPTLFNIHNWRKSVHSFIHFQPCPEFIFLKYESLVTDPQSELQRLMRFLQLDPGLDTGLEITPRRSSNSSFGNYSTVSEASVGRYKEILPATVIEYIEATCYAEMRWLGYTPSISSNPQIMSDIINTFTEPYDLQRDHPDPEYSRNPKHIALEKKRINYFFRESKTSPPIGMYPASHEVLKMSLGEYSA